MGKDLDILQAVKDNDLAGLTKLLLKATKQGKNKLIGSTKRLNINYQDGDGMCALHQAALMSSDQMLLLLLDSGALPAIRDNKGMIALHYAAWQGHSASVQILLQRGSPVNEQALEGETPLHLACQHGHFDVVSFLLNQHADPTICNKSLRTSLHMACENGRNRVVELLLRSNLCEKLLEDSPTDTLDNSRTTCLHLAARNGHTDILQTLLQAGMNVNRSTLKGTALHEAATAGKMEAVKLLLDWGIDVNRPNSYDQTALDIVTKSASGSGTGGKDLKRLLKEASCAVYARALRDYSNIYDPGSLSFKEGDIITVLEQRTDGIWRGYVVQEGRMARAGVFPANHVSLVDSKVYRQTAQYGHMSSQVPDLLPRGPPYSSSGNISSIGGHSILTSGSTSTHNGSDRGSLGSSGTDDSSSHHIQQQQQQPGSLPYPPPPSSLLPIATGGGFMPPRSPLCRDFSGADSGFSSSQSLPQYTPSSPAGPSQFGKSPFAFGPNLGSTVTTNGPSTPNGYLSAIADNNGCIPALAGNQPAFQYGPGTEWLSHHHQHQNHLAGIEGGGNNMRSGASPARDSPAHSNRNSAASSDSGRGYSTGGGHVLDSKLSHNYVNMHMSNNNINSSGHSHHYHNQLQHQKLVGSLVPQQHQQHRLSGQSYESGVSSRQSYHSSGSSSVGSLDLLEEQGSYSSSATINVGQLVQAGVADTEVLHAWLNDLEFGEYYPLFLQAGYDMPTISRMTPEDLTAIGITKPAHRKRLKSEIARLNIHDGIPEFRPSDLMEWLHLLGLGAYLDTLCGQGYDSLDFVTDITWEDLEEIGIKKLGHQKKIMLAIDRLKRLRSSGKRTPAIDGRTASLELLEPPPPAPPISGRWSGGEGMGMTAHVYDVSGGIVGGARPKKSPSGDSISTTSSGNSGSGSSGAGSGSHPYHGGEIRVIPLPREDAGGVSGMAGGIPYRHNSMGSASGLQPDVVAIQVKRNLRGSMSEDKRGPANSQGGSYFEQNQYGQHQQPQLMYHSFQGPVRRTSESDVFADHHQIRSFEAEDRRRPSIPAEFDSEKHEAELNTDGYKFPFLAPKTNRPGLNNGLNQSSLKVETGEHIYDTPQISPSQKSPRPVVMPKPSVSFAPNPGLAKPLHVSTGPDVSQPQSKSSPIGKGGKKVPPPPPIRTDSIRGDSVSRDCVPPGSPSRCLNTGQVPASTVGVLASIHSPHSSSISTSVSGPPKVATKPTPPPVMQKPQLPNTTVTAKIHQDQTPCSQPNSSQAHPTATSAQPVPSIVPVKAGSLQSRPEPAILIKPKVSTGPSSPYKQQVIKSPLPSKAPFGTASASAASNQSHQPHIQCVPSATHLVSGKPSDAHSQALSSCMKSLSEKIAGRTPKKEEKEKDDDDQFPDNVSTDSDDFPPPPPPIAMDIITPKIHNYGIPSTRKPGEYGLHHRHDFSHKPQHGLLGSPRMMGGPGVSPRIGPGVNYVEVHHRPDAATSRTAPLQTSSMSAAFRVQPTGHMSSPQALSNKLSSAQTMGTGTVYTSATSTNGPDGGVTNSYQISNSNFNSQPQTQLPDPAHSMSTENRSDSTSSFESTSSSSSLDSNTLPFANENVGTIKQRAAAITTLASDTTTTTTNSALPSVSVTGQTLAGKGQDSESHKGFMPSSPVSSSAPSFSHQRQPSGGGERPPVPSKKPTLSPKPVRLQAERTFPSADSSQLTAIPTAASTSCTKSAQKQLWPEQDESAHKHSSNVLSDIDDMLQGLTDELDAALEEELGS